MAKFSNLSNKRTQKKQEQKAQKEEQRKQAYQTARSKGKTFKINQQEIKGTPDEPAAAKFDRLRQTPSFVQSTFQNPQNIRNIQSQQQGITVGPSQTPNITPEQQAILDQQLAPANEQLEQAGAFQQVTPQETDFTPSVESTPVPIIGPSIGALTSTILENAYVGGLIRKKFPESLAGSEGFASPVTPETLREEALRQIRNDSYKKGISAGEMFGSFVESIPLAGSFVAKYIGGLVEAPYHNAKEVITEIKNERDRAASGIESVRNGLMQPEYALEEAQVMEENIAELEGRLKILINTSAILRANKDEVNRVQQEILRTKERVAQYKQAAAYAYTAELTGTGRTIPTDEKIYMELLNSKK